MTQPFGSDVRRETELTVRMDVPCELEKVKKILNTLGIIGTLEQTERGVTVVLTADTLDRLRGLVDDVLVALGDL